MPDIEVASLTDLAVLWPFTGYDDYSQPTVGNPIQIPCKWHTSRQEALDAKGDTITLDAMVIVDRKIHVDSLMWLGLVSEWSGQNFIGTGTSPDEELMVVKLYNQTNDIKGRASFRQVGLMRYRAL